MEGLVGGEDQIHHIDYPKAGYIENIVVSIIYFIAFLFFLFITIIVIRKEKKLDKVLVAMLVSLQLSSLSMAIYYVFSADDEGKYFT